MPSTITKNFRLFNAEQFKEQFGEANTSNLYLFIGRTHPWTDDNNPPTPTDIINDIQYSVWNSILAMKKVSSTDVTFAIPRNDWTSGTAYTQYQSNSTFHDVTTFHVLTDEYNVYKCLYNNGGANSTVKPTGRISTVFTTADEYKWKFMYEIPASDAIKYITPSFIPVKLLASDDQSFQWDTQVAAVNGSIETVGVSAGGSNYKTSVGTPQAANTTTITLASSANSTNDVYNGSSVYIDSGTGQGQLRRIVNYVGASRLATVNTAFSVAPTSSTYILSPTVTIAGDGRNALAYCTVNSGALDAVEVINRGLNYSYATATVTANTGSGGALVPHLSPKGGHGANPVQELYGHNVMINVTLSGNEDGNFFANNDYRVVGIIANPLLANGSIASATPYKSTPLITITGASGTFTPDETIEGGTSDATAKFVEYANSTVLVVSSMVGRFTTAESITGLSSGATATVSSLTVSPLKLYDGQILYVENRAPISRSADQEENYRIIVRF